jgi:hypothetical protein
MIDRSLVEKIEELAVDRADRRTVQIADQEGTEHSWLWTGSALNHVVPPHYAPSPLEFSTLRGLVRWLEEDQDGLALDEHAIHILDPLTVAVISVPRGVRRQRDTLVRVLHQDGVWSAEGRYLDAEDLLIRLLSQFDPSADRDRALSLLGTIRDEQVTQREDDGVTQTVVARQGIQRDAEINVSQPFHLKPHRTFPEVEQPESPFVLRFRGGGEETRPTAGLFLADSGRWKLDAMDRIAGWLDAAGAALPVLY